MRIGFVTSKLAPPEGSTASLVRAVAPRPLTAVVLSLLAASGGAFAQEAAQPTSREARSASSPGCRLFLLRHAEAKLGLQAVDLAAGESRRFPLGAASEWITFVLPLGPGKSADLVQAAAGPAELEARCAADGLHATVHRSRGEARSLPPVSRRDLEGYELRVNVRPGVGPGQVFAVRGGGTISEEPGPVLDLFGGRIPLAAGDYSITLETREAIEAAAGERPAAVAGSAPLVFDGEHHFLRGEVAGGGSGWFVVDLGAGRSVLARGALPPGVEPVPPSATEYSAAGAREVGSEMLGVGGAVGGFAGSAEIAAISAGSLRFEQAEVNVVEQLPAIGGRPLLGILGLDLLERAACVRLSYDPAGELRLSASCAATGPAVPFNVADHHLFVRGEIAGVPLSWVLDSGAKVSLLAPALADRLGLVADPSRSVEVRGLGSAAVQAPRVEAPELVLGEERFPQVAFHVAPLAVLDAWGLSRQGGILGNDFLRRFAALELSFPRGEVRFVPR